MTSPDDAERPPRRMPPLKAPDLLRTLRKHDVEFVVGGCVAGSGPAVWSGWAGGVVMGPAAWSAGAASG